MSVLFFVLKIIGVLLLVVLSLVVLAVLLVLFCPFGYRVRGSFHDTDKKARVRVTWLGGLVAFLLTYDEIGLQKFLCVAFSRKRLGEKKDVSQKERKKETLKKETPTEEASARPLVTAEAADVSEKTADEKTTGAKRIEKETADAGEKAGEKEPEKPSLLERICGFFETLSALPGKLSHGKEVLSAFQKEAEDEKNRAAVGRILTELWKLLVAVFPKRLRLSLVYSAGSPDVTGQLLGVLAAFPIAYQNRWRICPDFAADRAYAEADFDGRGRLFGICIFLAGMRILLDKNCQRLYNRVRHHMK